MLKVIKKLGMSVNGNSFAKLWLEVEKPVSLPIVDQTILTTKN